MRCSTLKELPRLPEGEPAGVALIFLDGRGFINYNIFHKVINNKD